MSFLHFLQYHNAVPIGFAILFLGSGTVLAASPEMRDIASNAVFEAQSAVVSVDNTYIANKDLANYTPQVKILEVTEDSEFYFVAYLFTTIDVVDHVWRDVNKNEVMKVSKADLGPYRDLGVYVTEQLKQTIDREIAYLKEVQDIEQRQVTNKVVATAYSGLVGSLLDDKTEKIPGYTPRVTEPGFVDPNPVAVVTPGSAGSLSGGSKPNTGPVGGSAAPVIQILGKNPAYIPLKASYSDLGALVTDDKNVNLGLKTYLNGKEMPIIQIDTASTSEWRVTYEATDTDNNITRAQRRVVVYDPKNPPVFEETPAPPAPAIPAPAVSEPESTPQPEPAPEPEPASTSTPDSEPAPEPESEGESDTATTTPPAPVEPAPATTTSQASATSTPATTSPAVETEAVAEEETASSTPAEE